MTDSTAITIIIPFRFREEALALQQTLLALQHWPDEILIADSIGLELPPLEAQTKIRHLPLLRLPQTVLHYRSALTAAHDWLLFLQPGDCPSQSFLSGLRRILEQSSAESEGLFTFSRCFHWQDIAWREPASHYQPDLVFRPVFLKFLRQEEGHALHPQTLSLDHRIMSDALIPTLQRHAEALAGQRLRNEGAIRLQSRLHAAWRNEVLITGLREGLLQGKLFKHKMHRIPLFIKLMKTHLQWFKLYSYLSSSP